MRHYGRKKMCQYLVKWKGDPDSNNEWVNHKDMNAPEAINEYKRTRGDKRRLCSLTIAPNMLMSSSPISVSSNSPTHLEILDALVTASANNLTEARAAFPMPEPGCISPNSLDSAPLNLTPTTAVHSAHMEANSPPVAEEAVARSQEEVGGLTDVLVLEYIGEEGESVVHCQNPVRGECSFCGANSQACLTHRIHHIDCGELLHECKCASPTLFNTSPDMLRHLPSVSRPLPWWVLHGRGWVLH